MQVFKVKISVPVRDILVWIRTVHFSHVMCTVPGIGTRYGTYLPYDRLKKTYLLQKPGGFELGFYTDNCGTQGQP
jgi:hypothetical protein